MRIFVQELPNTLKFHLIAHVKGVSINNEKFHKSVMWHLSKGASSMFFLPKCEILLKKFFPEKSTIQDLFKTSLVFYFIYF